MDISYDNDEIVRRCFKIDEHVFYNLNIINNATNSTFTLWNKFQIFAYENLEFESISKVIVPDFQIHNLITSNNYLVCIDCTGNIHTCSLKFKNAAQKRFKYSFQPRESGVLACSFYGEEHAICLKLEAEAYFLSVHKINTEFSLEKKVIIMCKDEMIFPPKRDKYIIKSYNITESHIECLKKVFNSEEVSVRKNLSLVVISFDKSSVYGCLFNMKMPEDEVTLVKLYTFPSEIAGIEFIEAGELNIVIALTIGTLISLNVKDLSPEIIHLNTAIYKFSTFKDSILYTDGLTMWKAERILSNDIKFAQFFIKDVKDFIKFGDQIICTTFTNLIYTLSIDDERSYVKPKSTDEYCAAEKLLNNTIYLKKIIEEVKKNEGLIKMQIKEKNYITALCLSNRQDVMDKIINKKIIVYESYEDAISENTDVLLTNIFSEYFDSESFYFLINITTMTEHRFNEVLSYSLGDLRVHITFNSKGKSVQTITVKVTDLLRKTSLLIPLKIEWIDVTEMRVDVKIITNIPGALDAQQKIWTVLYRKTVNLSSEHFIKFNFNCNKNISLKESKESLAEQILQVAMHQYNGLFDFTDITQNRPERKTWQMYVRLPIQYEQLFKNEGTLKKSNSRKVNYFLQQFTSTDFLKSKTSFILSIGKEKVKIEIDNDGFSHPSMKVSSENLKMTSDIRNFLSNLIYSVFADVGLGKEFVNHSFYITVENIQKAVKECLTSSSEDELLAVIDQFERKIIGLIPI